MLEKTRYGIILFATFSLAVPAAAEGDFEIRWSATFEAAVKDIASSENDDDVTGFFDQYEFTANKDSSFPVELGFSNFEFDLLGTGETPLLQIRMRSPTSNVGVSGEDAERPFLNQRAEVWARPKGVKIDLEYRRMRTDELRLFPNPNPTGAGTEIASAFNDDTGGNDRFSVRRTLFGGEVRLRPQDLTAAEGPLDWLAPELSLRGGYEDRNADRQFRFMFGSSDPSPADNTLRWRGVRADMKQEVSDIGGGLLVAPGGLFTLVFDVDHEHFHEHSPTFLQNRYGEPPIASNNGTINFIPDTDRITGSVRFHSRFGESGVIHGGFQVTQLEQVKSRTPGQLAASNGGLLDNEIRFYSANLAADVGLAQSVSANAFFKFDFRNNQIERDTSLFNETSGSQVDEFLDNVRRIEAGAELVFRPQPGNLLALGYRTLFVDRDLDFAMSGSSNDHTLDRNASVEEDSQSHTVYLRSQLRPAAGLRFAGEAGYRDTPETGYIRELDNVAFFKVRGSYMLPLSRPATLSVFGRGEVGRNRDFTQFSETTASFGNPDRDFDRENFAYGVSLTGAPCDQVTLFASFFHHLDAQDFDLVRSNNRKFKEPRTTAVDFVTDSPLDYRADLINVLFGSSIKLAEFTDLGVSYSFTRSEAKFKSDNATGGTIESFSEVRNEIHSVDVTLGHWITEGLRVSAGYRFDKFRDRTEVPAGTGSVVTPFNLSNLQHTVTLGVTLTSDLLRRN